jgi:hypothetical protein
MLVFGRNQHSKLIHVAHRRLSEELTILAAKLGRTLVADLICNTRRIYGLDAQVVTIMILLLMMTAHSRRQLAMQQDME